MIPTPLASAEAVHKASCNAVTDTNVMTFLRIESYGIFSLSYVFQIALIDGRSGLCRIRSRPDGYRKPKRRTFEAITFGFPRPLFTGRRCWYRR
jgi:hypothetical protein